MMLSEKFKDNKEESSKLAKSSIKASEEFL
jgi:hypothetical protein